MVSRFNNSEGFGFADRINNRVNIGFGAAFNNRVGIVFVGGINNRELGAQVVSTIGSFQFNYRRCWNVRI